MSMENIMNEDGNLDHGDTSVISNGTFTIISSPDSQVKASGKGVYFGQVDFSFSGGNASGCDNGTVTGSGSILPSAMKVKNRDGNIVMRENDETVTGSFMGTLGSNPVTIGNQPVKVSDAGQNKVKGQ